MVIGMIEALLHLIGSIPLFGLSCKEASLNKEKRELEARIAELKALIEQEEREARQEYRFGIGAGYPGIPC